MTTTAAVTAAEAPESAADAPKDADAAKAAKHITRAAGNRIWVLAQPYQHRCGGGIKASATRQINQARKIIADRHDREAIVKAALEAVLANYEGDSWMVRRTNRREIVYTINEIAYALGSDYRLAD